jgi:nitroreductase
VPVIIIPCTWKLEVNTGIASGSSIYPAIQNLMLAARALGLGTALTTIHRWNEQKVRTCWDPESAERRRLSGGLAEGQVRPRAAPAGGSGDLLGCVGAKRA